MELSFSEEFKLVQAAQARGGREIERLLIASSGSSTYCCSVPWLWWWLHEAISLISSTTVCQHQQHTHGLTCFENALVRR